MSDEAFEVTGFAELQENFQALEDQLSVKKAAKELTGALVAALKDFVDQARARAHRLTYFKLWRRRRWPTNPLHVADAIRAQWAPSDSNEVAATAGVPKSHFWGLFLEYGTKFARAYPFLRPAWQPVVVLDRVASSLAERLAKAKLRAARP